MANRISLISTLDATGHTTSQSFSQSPQSASKGFVYTFAPGRGNSQANFLFVLLISDGMPDVVLGPGAQLTVTVGFMQVADQLSNITLMVEKITT